MCVIVEYEDIVEVLPEENQDGDDDKEFEEGNVDETEPSDRQESAESKDPSQANTVKNNNVETVTTTNDETKPESDSSDQPTEEIVKPLTKIVIRKKFVTRYKLMMSIDHMLPDMYERSSIYFIKSTNGDIPKTVDYNDFSSYFEFSIMTGEILSGIANIVHQLYLPIVQGDTNDNKLNKDPEGAPLIKQIDNNLQISPKSRNVNELAAVDDVNESMRYELTLNIKKFEQQLRHVVHQSRGDTRLIMPSFNISNTEEVIQDPHLLGELVNLLEDWRIVISQAIETELLKSSKVNNTPLGEIEYWRTRQANVSTLYDQLNSAKVQQVIAIVKTLENSPQLGAFEGQLGELTKLYLEAKDNVKFLTTLERHFKHISEGSFQTILESIPSMINGLRMVWVISRHYNTDDRMAPLMEMIAETLAKRVRDEVKLTNILTMEYFTAKRLVSEAKDVLTQWNENYFRMRKTIEDSKSDHR